MKFCIQWETSGNADSKIKFFTPIIQRLSIFFQNKSYGTGLSKIILGLNCVGGIVGLSKDFPTGLIIHKKYNRKQQTLEVLIKLNYRAMTRLTKKTGFESALAMMREVMNSLCTELENTLATSFNSSSFRNDVHVALLFKDNTTEHDPIPLLINNPIDKSAPRNTLVYEAISSLPEATFWKIIANAGEITNYQFDKQCEILINQLALENEHIIISFELQLRKYLKELYHYDILGLAKIVEGHVSDDSFIYFCCGLILLGPEAYNQAIKKADTLTIQLSQDGLGEYLLAVSDQAFLLRLGTDTSKTMPSEYGRQLYDYDAPDIAMVGQDWRAEELPDRFPRLFAKYWNHKK